MNPNKPNDNLLEPSENEYEIDETALHEIIIDDQKNVLNQQEHIQTLILKKQSACVYEDEELSEYYSDDGASEEVASLATEIGPENI